MGYSATAAAFKAYDKMIDLLRNEYGLSRSTNCWGDYPVEHFAEIGKENTDGAITGAIFRSSLISNKCRKIGSFRVEPNGTVTRWATSKAHHRKLISAYGNAHAQMNTL